MTSPPYGDNKTTVPYGQHSYLPLQWINPDDIPGGFDVGVLDSTGALDSRSLGGSLTGALAARDELCQMSPSLGAFLPLIQGRPALEKKVLAFVRDYRSALHFAFERLRPNGYSFLTLGERRVGGHTMPLVAVTRELLEADQQQFVDLIERRLFRKRMATVNSEGTTMRKESILVMRAPAGAG
jgi:site-specific DNA-methyltransferase (cytosine-N4-specific)